LREVRACAVCITHYSLEYLGELPYPEIEAILDAYAVMKGGTGKGKRVAVTPNNLPVESDRPVWEQQAVARETRKENKKNRVHPTALPLTVQQQLKELRNRAKRD
jgi:hypothetical protein